MKTQNTFLALSLVLVGFGAFAQSNDDVINPFEAADVPLVVAKNGPAPAIRAEADPGSRLESPDDSFNAPGLTDIAPTKYNSDEIVSVAELEAIDPSSKAKVEEPVKIKTSAKKKPGKTAKKLQKKVSKKHKKIKHASR